ncbi:MULTISPECIES: hypothetical protein [Clostridia]|uniref:hypothetical protein n=1 Tax=Clostridia TaxID=186801 RepID=UPI000EA09ED5|nr:MULTISPECIES: hypothetical protein [Clostridia]NBJ67982.1 hypothetical protein [Roseburia sp. 1XD42-34]RKI82426.1 hypothetical protein D7V87_00625 [Clostridium sp. 1xD42-85]
MQLIAVLFGIDGAVSFGISFAFPYKEAKKNVEQEIDPFTYFAYDRNWEELVPYQQKQWEFPVPQKVTVTSDNNMGNKRQMIYKIKWWWLFSITIFR